MEEDHQAKADWTAHHEEILIDWADKAKCYHWLHNRCQKKYNALNNWFTIPVIVLSTATGTANLAQYRLTNAEVKSYAPFVLGCVNICTGILTTVQQFLKINELNEAHRLSALGWDKLYRNIKVELARHPSEREAVSLLTKTCKEEMNRLLETSPDIDESVLGDFHRTFRHQKTRGWCGELCGWRSSKVSPEERQAFDRMKKPDICGTMRSAADFRHPWGTAQETQTEDNEPVIQLIGIKNERVEKEEECIATDGVKQDCTTKTSSTEEQITLEVGP